MGLVCLNKWSTIPEYKDPVRPELSTEFRTTGDREFYSLLDSNVGIPRAFLCVAYTKTVPEVFSDLKEQSDIKSDKEIAMFYSVWSNAKGSGRDILNMVLSTIKQKRTDVNRYVTFSPKTEMAEKFHLSNGARVLRRNTFSDNYEYD